MERLYVDLAIEKVLTELRQRDHSIPEELDWTIVHSSKVDIAYAVVYFPFQDNLAVLYTIDITATLTKARIPPVVEVLYYLYYTPMPQNILQQGTLHLPLQEIE